MPRDKSRLKVILDSKALLKSEKDMWMAFGFYMYHGKAGDSVLYLSDGASEGMSSQTAKEFRNTIIEIWESRPNQPAKTEEEKFVHPLDAHLESRNDA